LRSSQYLRTQFRIRLHIDDVDVLYKIKEFLGVGTVEKYNNNCLYSIRNIKEMNQILFPLLDQHKLISTKYLDYIDFKLVVNYLTHSNSTLLRLVRRKIRMS
jgi:LAGLIDADG endonuclease